MNQKGRTKDMGENIVWNSKIARLILIHLNKKEIDYASNTAKEIGFWLGGTLIKFKELREGELIELVENRGRNKYPFVYKSKKNKYYKLTAKGKKITELLLKIEEELK